MFSIIIPTHNEEESIYYTLQNLEKLEGEFEVIIVDSNVDSYTKEKIYTYSGNIIPKIFDATYPGRANQMNIGAKNANGKILLFLHADTTLEKNALNAISKKILEGYIGGAFTLHFQTSKIIYSFISFYSNCRAKLFHIYHGDQTQFIKKEVFDKIGGFPDIPLMEDVVLSKKMKAFGPVVQISSLSTTSPRRIESYGIIKSIFRYFYIKILFFFHTSPEKLAKIYNRA